MGQMLITCSLAKTCIIFIDGNKTNYGKINEIKISKKEPAFLALGFLSRLIGAVVESVAIIGL